MTTNYANQKLTTAIRDHLLNVDAVPPNAEASRLASELAQVCLIELNTAGLRMETVENLFTSAALKAKARGGNKRTRANDRGASLQRAPFPSSCD